MKSFVIFLISIIIGLGTNEADIKEVNNCGNVKTVISTNNCMSVAFSGTWEDNDIINEHANNIAPSDANNEKEHHDVKTTNTTVVVDNDANNVQNQQNQNSSDEDKNVVSTEPQNNDSVHHNNSEQNNPTHDKEENSHVTETTIPTVPETTEPTNNSNNNDVTEETRPVKKCTEHNYKFISTSIDEEYRLYNYVTDYYKCEFCSATKSESHIKGKSLSSSEINREEQVIFNALNDLRKSQGLSELWTNDYWNSYAATRAKELATSYGHSRPNGASWSTANDTHFTVGENIAAGNQSGYDFYVAFLNSGSHYGTMTVQNAVGVGIGIYVNEESGQTFCAMILVAPF